MTQRNEPALGPIVTVDKGRGRKVMLAVVDANRMLCHGFFADWPASINYRILRHGPYSVLVLTDAPVEVRIIQDGTLLTQQRLDPAPRRIAGSREASQVRRQARELVARPQPFYVSQTDDQSALTFAPDPEGRSAEERLAMQLYPRALRPEGSAGMHGPDEPVGIGEAVSDIEPASIPWLMPPKALSPADGDSGGSDSGHDTADGELAAAAGPSEMHLASQSDDSEPEPDAERNRLDAPVPADWAPSYGLIAVGVRMIQVPAEGEPVMPPDGYSYVLFQLNTFADNARVRANLHSRVRLPESIPQIDDGQGGGSPMGPVGNGCGTGLGSPRRFR